MTPAVVSVLREHRSLAAHFLPNAQHETIAGAGRLYFLYAVVQPGTDSTFVDPTDGELLAGVYYFETESDAREWVAQDIAMRDARVGRVQ